MTFSEDALQNGVRNWSPQPIRVHRPKPNKGTDDQLHVAALIALSIPACTRFFISGVYYLCLECFAKWRQQHNRTANKSRPVQS
jgi:hypothetical protein